MHLEILQPIHLLQNVTSISKVTANVVGKTEVKQLHVLSLFIVGENCSHFLHEIQPNRQHSVLNIIINTALKFWFSFTVVMLH